MKYSGDGGWEEALLLGFTRGAFDADVTASGQSLFGVSSMEVPGRNDIIVIKFDGAAGGGPRDLRCP